MSFFETQCIVCIILFVVPPDVKNNPSIKLKSSTLWNANVPGYLVQIIVHSEVQDSVPGTLNKLGN